MLKKAKTVINEVEGVVDTVDKKVINVIKETNKYVDPVRQTTFKKFPTLFLILVAFGVSATFYGFELLISDWPFLYERPWLILLVGLSVLAGTGTLYKKLG